MNQDVIPPQRRSGSVFRTIRVLLTIAALTGVGLSVGACQPFVCGFDDGWGSECGK